MNDKLKKIVVAAGAPDEALNELWFTIFCLKFAHLLLELAEQECST
jgi:hypothetical protein